MCTTLNAPGYSLPLCCLSVYAPVWLKTFPPFFSPAPRSPCFFYFYDLWPQWRKTFLHTSQFFTFSFPAVMQLTVLVLFASLHIRPHGLVSGRAALAQWRRRDDTTNPQPNIFRSLNLRLNTNVEL